MPRATLPRLAITIGDPAGIGPEIVLKAIEMTRSLEYQSMIVGDGEIILALARSLGISLGRRHDIVDTAPTRPVPIGVATAEGGESAWKSITTATHLCLSGRADVMVTAPINKVALDIAGHGSTGHTEILQELTGSPWSLTLFVLGDLRALFYSRHLSLRDAIDRVSADGIRTVLERFASVAPAVGLDNPRIAVAALNPHGGEGGLFGREEIDHIAPGIEAARALGIDVHGPIPADAVYAQAHERRYDVVLGLYHDQVAGALKAIDFHGTVSITLGLPFLRFSVDHGTAFDIAGTGRADAANMIATIQHAVRFAQRSS